MTARQRRYPKEEIARRGGELYERHLRPAVQTGDKGKYVAIDVEGGAWEMDESEIAAGNRLRQRVPDAQIWMVRVGYDAVRRFGAGRAERGVIAGMV